MRCSNCDSTNAESAKFCSKCGTRLGTLRREQKIIIDNEPRLGGTACLVLVIIFVGLPLLLFLFARGVLIGLIDAIRGVPGS